jgi:hypothetical protein
MARRSLRSFLAEGPPIRVLQMGEAGVEPQPCDSNGVSHLGAGV